MSHFERGVTGRERLPAAARKGGVSVAVLKGVGWRCRRWVVRGVVDILGLMLVLR